jgi:hypothetical protein
LTGVVNTDFGGRYLDFNNDEALTEYQGLIKSVFEQFDTAQQSASPVSAIADVIYKAATDDLQQLRYIAGLDSKSLIEKRAKEDYKSFIGYIEGLYTSGV